MGWVNLFTFLLMVHVNVIGMLFIYRWVYTLKDKTLFKGVGLIVWRSVWFLLAVGVSYVVSVYLFTNYVSVVIDVVGNQLLWVYAMIAVSTLVTGSVFALNRLIDRGMVKQKKLVVQTGG